MTRRITHAARQAEAGALAWGAVVKRSEVLAGVDAEAGLPYAQTRLAQRAVGARRRLSFFLLGGVVAFLLEAALARNAWWLLGAVALGLTAWGLRKGRLGALVAAALAAVLAVLLPLRFLVLGLPEAPGIVTGIVSVVFGLALLPDVLLLVRDAELQYAYGMWARREGPREPPAP